MKPNLSDLYINCLKLELVFKKSLEGEGLNKINKSVWERQSYFPGFLYCSINTGICCVEKQPAVK